MSQFQSEMSKNKNVKQIRGAVGKAASFFCMILQKKQKKFYKNTLTSSLYSDKLRTINELNK